MKLFIDIRENEWLSRKLNKDYITLEDLTDYIEEQDNEIEELKDEIRELKGENEEEFNNPSDEYIPEDYYC